MNLNDFKNRVFEIFKIPPGILNDIMRPIVHVLLPVRRFQYKILREFTKDLRNKKILDIGTGKYNVEAFFHESNSVLKTDVNPDYGHEVVSVTSIPYKNEFDVITCINVLEHVPDTQRAVKSLCDALKSDGVLFLSTPFIFPLHDVPHDYYRFTEFGLRRLFEPYFREIKIHRGGIRQFPYTYVLVCRGKKQ